MEEGHTYSKVGIITLLDNDINHQGKGSILLNCSDAPEGKRGLETFLERERKKKKHYLYLYVCFFSLVTQKERDLIQLKNKGRKSNKIFV